jgi:hypothetical protein
MEFVVLIASAMNTMRRVVTAVLEVGGPIGSWVDDDYGHVIRGDAFLARLAREPGWNLRADG